MAVLMGYSTELYKKMVIPILLLVVSLFLIGMLFTYPAAADLRRTINSVGNAALLAKTASNIKTNI